MSKTETRARCGYAVTDDEGIEQPCDRPATGWRWYQDCVHQDCLEAACDIHANYGGDRMHAAERDLAAARAEVAALRSRISALVEGWLRLAADSKQRAQRDDLSQRVREKYAQAEDLLTDVAEQARAVLAASVGSSGEAESGEAVEIRHCDGCGEDYNAFEESHVGHEVRPAPVSSGGQADEPGECCAEFVEAACEVGHRILIDDGDGTVYACPACALAARPVLSREALRARLDGHWPELSEDRDDFDSAYVVCRCGWRYDYVRDGRSRVASWRDHLADVLAGGEQA